MAKDKNKEKNKNVVKQLELTEEQASQVRGGTEKYQIISAGNNEEKSLDLETKKLQPSR